METNFVVIVSAKTAQKSREILEKHNIWDGRRRFKTIEGNRVAIPVLSDDIDLQILSSVLDEDQAVISKMVLPLSKKSSIKTPYVVLKDNVKDFITKCGHEWTSELEDDLPKSWEKHGDLILLNENCFKLAMWKENEQELWKVVCRSLNCNRLAIKSVISNDGYRSPQVQLVVGNNGWVEQVDNKLRFTYDISKCMFSIGNITEKLRIAQLNCSDETVVDLYAGIGYFTIPYLVHANADHVHACEWNPHAIEALKNNLELNNVKDRCTVYQGDNKKVCPVNLADRVNLGLIPSSEEGWPVACAALKKDRGGFLHIHANVTSLNQDNVESSKLLSNDLCDNSKNDCALKNSEHRTLSPRIIWNKWAEETAGRIHTMLCEYHQNKWTTHIHNIEHVKSYAPHVDHIVLDLECRPSIPDK